MVSTDRIGDDINANLALMRRRMIEENDFVTAVFVGRMAGIIDEYEMFRQRAPSAAVLPLVSTGGAARVLGKRLGADAGLASNLDYVQLLYERLGVDPNERRYAKASEQPPQVGDRI